MSILDHQCTETDGEVLEFAVIVGRCALRAAVIGSALLLLYQPVAFFLAKL